MGIKIGILVLLLAASAMADDIIEQTLNNESANADSLERQIASEAPIVQTLQGRTDAASQAELQAIGGQLNQLQDMRANVANGRQAYEDWKGAIAWEKACEANATSDSVKQGCRDTLANSQKAIQQSAAGQQVISAVNQQQTINALVAAHPGEAKAFFDRANAINAYVQQAQANIVSATQASAAAGVETRDRAAQALRDLDAQKAAAMQQDFVDFDNAVGYHPLSQ